jgi:hypothetical protein
MSARRCLVHPHPSRTTRPADARVRPSQAKVEQEVLAPQVLSRRLESRPWLPPRRSAHAPRRKLCPRHDKGQHGRCSCSTPPAGFVHCSRNGSRRARDIYLAQQGAHASNGGSRAAICARAVARRAHGGTARSRWLTCASGAQPRTRPRSRLRRRQKVRAVTAARCLPPPRRPLSSASARRGALTCGVVRVAAETEWLM